MSAADGVLRWFDVQRAERELFGYASLCLLLVGAAALALLNTAETLFLKRVGVEFLPLALLASSGLLVVTTGLIGRLAGSDPDRWLPRILLCLALAPLPFTLLVESRSDWVFGALLLVSRQVLALGILGFWLAVGVLLPVRRAKQLFAPLAASMTAGGIVGSFGSGPAAALLGVEGLLALCGLLLAGAASLGVALRRSGTRRLDRALGASSARAVSSVAAGAGLWELLRTSRLFRLLSVGALCGGGLYPVLYFEFTSVLDAATSGPDGEQRLLALYSQFRGWLNVSMLAFQLWVSRALYRRLGLPLAMLSWPAAYVLGLTWLGLDFALVAAFTSFGAAMVSEEGVSDPAARVLYNLFPEEQRGAASGLLEGPLYRGGEMLGNAAVLSALALGGVAWVGWAALPVAVLWFAASLVFWRAYPGLLLEAASKHGLVAAGSDRATLLDSATLRSLAAALADRDPHVCRTAVDLVTDGDPTLVVGLLAEAIERAPDETRPLLVDALHRLIETLPPDCERGEAAPRAIERALRSRPSLPTEQRCDLVQIYARLTAEADAGAGELTGSRALIERAMRDADAAVRLAALAELHRRGSPPPGLPDLDRMLADALSAPDALVRRAARKELRALLVASRPDDLWARRVGVLARHLESRADRAETAEALSEIARRHGPAAQDASRKALRYADDRDPRVRGALLCMAGHAGLVGEAPRLVASLGAREAAEAGGAREGIVALGPISALPLLVGLEFGGPARREAVLDVLRELEVDAATLEDLRVRQLAAIHEALVHRAAVVGLDGAALSLLRRRLEGRIAEGVGALLDLLSAQHQEPRLAELERRLRRGAAGRERDLLIEAIEALLGHGEREAIVPLLEPGDWTRRGELSARVLGRRPPDRDAALAELGESPDATTRLLAGAASLEGSGAIGDARPMPPNIDIAARLQAVPAFDRLSTQQLMALAGALQEQKVAAGERVYAAGGEGASLFFVFEGEVELRRGTLVLERVGAGSYFGEIAVLDGVPRSEDAVACAETRLLVLDRDDLLRLLDEAPGLAIGLAQRLSARVRSLENKLEEAVAADGAAP